MLAVISSQVYSDLSSFEALTALLDAGVNGIKALVANEEDGDSFITFFVKYEQTESKDGAAAYQLITNSWAPTYDESIAIADQVLEALKASNYQYRPVSGTPTYNEQNEIYTQQIFNILK